MKTTLGIIGGSGIYELDCLEGEEHIELDTPCGPPSSPIVTGHVGETKLCFIARHGLGHTLLPSEVNYRANIWALKKLGAQWCLGVSAVGSLTEEIAPGHLVIGDQIVDRTYCRTSTFFGGGVVAHVAFGSPFCPVLRNALIEATKHIASGARTSVHTAGVYLCMEGPAFSTRAESMLYRTLGATIIGMTALPEAKLAREAEIAYANLSLVTDYDCWRSHNEEVNSAEIIKTLSKNSAIGKEIIVELAEALGSLTPSSLAKNALRDAIITDRAHLRSDLPDGLRLIMARYLT